MKLRTSRLAGVAALAAALSMTATPSAAVDLPQPVGAAATAYAPLPVAEADEYNQYRRYRHYRHRNRGVDAGDVIAGVVVIGALAAILGSSRSRERDRDRDYRDADYRYDRRDSRSDYESRGMERAVDMCIDQVDRGDERVETVDNAQRGRDGWHISGGLEDGASWTCTIDNDGRIRNIDIGGPAYSYGEDGDYRADAASQGDRQFDDEYYQRARASTRTAADDDYRPGPVPASGTPAYPGGPLPGEEGYDANWHVDADLDEEWDGDGRYDTAMATRP